MARRSLFFPSQVTPISFGTVQTPARFESSDHESATFTGMTVDSGANKALAIFQAQPAFNRDGDFATTTATLNGNSMMLALHGAPGTPNFRYGMSFFFWIDSPTAGDLVITYPGTASDAACQGTWVTFIPIFDAPAGAGAFGATNTAQFDTATAAMPLSITTTAADSWLFSALTRRDADDGPFTMDDTGLMTELFDTNGTLSNSGCGVSARGQASTVTSYNVGGDATSASPGTNHLSTAAALELLQP